jgi:hypothetical protein
MSQNNQTMTMENATTAVSSYVIASTSPDVDAMIADPMNDLDKRQMRRRAGMIASYGAYDVHVYVHDNRTWILT